MSAIGTLWRRRWRRSLVHAAVLGGGIAVCVLATAVVEGMLFPRLPYPSAERLVWIGSDSRYDGALGVSMSQYEVLSQLLEHDVSLAPFMLSATTLRTEQGLERVPTARVGGEFFPVLGVRARFGRLLDSDDDRVGAERVAVISSEVWRRLFGSDPRAIGRLLLLDERAVRVVGILGPGDGFPALRTGIWVPLAQTIGPTLRTSDAPYLRLLGRGRSSGAATPAQLLRLVRGRLMQAPMAHGAVSDGRPHLIAEGLSDHLIGDARLPILLLTASAAFLLLVACVSAATIQLAAQGTLERDVAIRRVLGATVGQLWRETLGETAVVAVMAAAIGLGAAWVSLHVLQIVGEATIPELSGVHLSPVACGTAAALATFSAFVVTGLPLAALLRSSASATLSGTSQTLSASRGGATMRDALNGIAIGVAVLFALGAASAAETIERILAVDMGFVAQDVDVAEVRLPFQQVTGAEAGRIRAFVHGLDGALRERNPGTVMAVSTDVPGKGTQSVVTIEVEATASRDARQLEVGMSQVGENYFDLLHIPVLRGRAFDVRDGERAPMVVVIDGILARRAFGATDATGKYLKLTSLGTRAEVVGVVGVVRQAGRLSENLPQLYVPFEQLPLATLAVLVAGRESSRGHREDLAQAVHAADPTAAMSAVAPLADQVYDEVRRPQFYATTLVIFAIIATIVSAAAVHAAVAALVAQRKREIGIRVALGARGGHIVALVLGRVAVLGALGSIAGTLVGLFVVSVVRSRVDVLGHPSTGAVLGSVACIWTAGVLAVFLPLREASQVSPVRVLKS